MMQGDNNISTDTTVSFCPSFSSYSSDKLVDVATKVTQESVDSHQSNLEAAVVEDSQQRNDDVRGSEDEFEFVPIRTESDTCQLFFDGQIRQVFPVFNRDLLLSDKRSEPREENIRFPLKKLSVDDQGGEGGPPSSLEVDELEGVTEGTYCVWSPRRNPTDLSSSPNIWKKSNSTGSSSSKRWLKFRDLLKRSKSEGNDPYGFLNKTKTNKNADSKEKKKRSSEVKNGKKVSAPAHVAFYVKNRAIKEGDKKRSYLPYRRDLVGFFANVNSLGRTFPPF